MQPVLVTTCIERPPLCCNLFTTWVIPYQFSQVLCMTPSELDENQFQPIACMALQKCLIFGVIMNVQCIISWAFTNELCHLKAQRISFHLLYLTA